MCVRRYRAVLAAKCVRVYVESSSSTFHRDVPSVVAMGAYSRRELEKENVKNDVMYLKCMVVENSKER